MLYDAGRDEESLLDGTMVSGLRTLPAPLRLWLPISTAARGVTPGAWAIHGPSTGRGRL